MADQTYSDVRDRLSDRETVFSALHREMAIDETLILGSAVMGDTSVMQYLSGFPAGALAKLPPIALDAVHGLRNQILIGQPPEVHVKAPSYRRGDQKDEKARRIELKTN